MRTYFIRVPRWAKMIYPKAFWDIGGNGNQADVAWTIDDGPDPSSTLHWLDYLSKNNLKVTFYLIGSKCEKYPELVTSIRKEGHQIGSHGYNHLDGWKTSHSKYLEDVEKSLDIIETDLFRPPYGRMTFSQYMSISSLCQIMMWSMMPGDFDENVDSHLLKQRIQNSVSGDVLVLHDNFKCFDKIQKAGLIHAR